MSQWGSGDSLTPSRLNRKVASARTTGGVRSNTVRQERGNRLGMRGSQRWGRGGGGRRAPARGYLVSALGIAAKLVMALPRR